MLVSSPMPKIVQQDLDSGDQAFSFLFFWLSGIFVHVLVLMNSTSDTSFMFSCISVVLKSIWPRWICCLEAFRSLVILCRTVSMFLLLWCSPCLLILQARWTPFRILMRSSHVSLSSSSYSVHELSELVAFDLFLCLSIAWSTSKDFPVG